LAVDLPLDWTTFSITVAQADIQRIPQVLLIDCTIKRLHY
jgi:hypothetical protein